MKPNTITTISNRQFEQLQQKVNTGSRFYIAYLLLHEDPTVIRLLPDRVVLCFDNHREFNYGTFIALPKMPPAMRKRYHHELDWHSISDRITEEDLAACLKLFQKTIEDLPRKPTDTSSLDFCQNIACPYAGESSTGCQLYPKAVYCHLTRDPQFSALNLDVTQYWWVSPYDTEFILWESRNNQYLRKDRTYRRDCEFQDSFPEFERKYPNRRV